MDPKRLEKLTRDLDSWRPSRWKAAAEELGRRGDPAALAPLVALLCRAPSLLDGPPVLVEIVGGESHSRYAAAALALGQLGDRRAVEPLIEALGTTAWGAAVEALAQLGDPRAVGPLSQVLRSWPRVVVIDALCRLGGQRAVGPLLGVGADGLAPRDAREAATRALVELGRSVLLPVVREVQAHYGLGIAYWADKAEREAGVQPAGPGQLEFLGDDRALGTLLRALVRADDDSHGAIGRQVVEGWVGLAPGVVPGLLAVAERDRSAARFWAAEALGRLGGQETRARLTALFGQTDAAARQAAAVGLGLLGEARALEELRAALESSEAQARRAAAAALGVLGAPAAPALEQLRHLASRVENTPVRSACREAIERIVDAMRQSPAELEAAPPPQGSGTELEATGAPAGRGTELEA